MAKITGPTKFGRYELIERIAIGGMAEIFYAKLTSVMGFEKGLVIKRILPQFAEDPEFLRMFITEAKLVCHLEHPNIVQVHELGEIEDQYYISMEYVNGIDGRQLWRTLAKRKQRLPGVLALFIVAEFLKGLDYAHRAVGPDGQLLGVVHRDVSPSNVLLSFRGDVKIGDFGIALVQQESKTQAGVLKGKFGYMSPEQVAGLRVDHRSDIFAAGIVLAELLLGRRLFLGASDFETLDKVMNVRLDVLEEHEHALPPEAVRVVRQALQRDVNDRYQSAREFYEDINEYLYQQGHRITNETLAAFAAEHVTPYLSLTRRDAALTSSSGSYPSPPVRSPIVRNIIPDVPPDGAPEVDVNVPVVPTPTPDSDNAGEGILSLKTTPDEVPTPSGDEIPLDHPAFDSLPMLDMDKAEVEGPPELDLSPDAGFVRLRTPSAIIEGAGEELELDALEQEELYEYEIPDGMLSDIDPFDQAHGLVEKQLEVAEVEERKPGVEPDFKGVLSARTVTKVLFRFSVVEETGLLVLTGPKHSGKQAELLDWLHNIQLRANATITAEATSNRTCEIHLLEGQPHLASADRSEEALIAYLIGCDVLSSHRVEMAIRNNPHRRPIAALLAAGALAPLQVSRHVVSFVLDSIFDTFSWIDGSFTFHRAKEASSESFPTGQDAMELIVNGVSHLPQSFLERYFQRIEEQHIVANRMPPARIERFNPDPVLLEVYRTLGTSQQLQKILAMCGKYNDPVQASQALYLLIECELASLV